MRTTHQIMARERSILDRPVLFPRWPAIAHITPPVGPETPSGKELVDDDFYEMLQSMKYGRKRMIHRYCEQGGKCYYCDRPMFIGTPRCLPVKKQQPRQATLDHFVPRSRGGSNRKDNVVAACFRCNKEKKDMMPETFAAVRNRKGGFAPPPMPSAQFMWSNYPDVIALVKRMGG